VTAISVGLHVSLQREMDMSRMLCGVAVLLIVAVGEVPSATAQAWALPQASSETHALDSLLGKWTFVQDLHNPQYPKVKGTWTFNRSADGFMVIDEFRSFNGSGGTALVGETYRAYNPDKKTWSFQATIYEAPMIGPRNGEWDAGTTRVQDGQVLDEVTNGGKISRARFYNMKTDSFSCVLDTSNDGGKTWVNPIDIEAMRARD
jgi:Neuraminidase (sialidase)